MYLYRNHHCPTDSALMKMSVENLAELWDTWQSSPDQLIYEKALKPPKRVVNFLGSEKKYKASFLKFAEAYIELFTGAMVLVQTETATGKDYVLKSNEIKLVIEKMAKHNKTSQDDISRQLAEGITISSGHCTYEWKTKG